MKMIIIYSLISIIFGFIAYLSSNNYIAGVAVLLLTLVYFFLFFMKRLKNYVLQNRRFKSSFNFINSFIVSLSIKLTIPGALESVVPTMDEDFKQEYVGLKHLSDDEKLDYLKKYYHFHIYELFLNVVALYEERGGNIFDMSNFLMQEARNQYEYTLKCEKMAIHKWLEFVVLWALALGIMVLLRFALSQFFDLLASKFYYVLAVIVEFVFLLFSVELLSRRSFNVEVKGWKEKYE